jgi:Ca2+-binding RTX toxin-like protein
MNTIVGTSGNDFLPGTIGDDTLQGLAGNDSMVGYDGNDIFIGGPDDDFMQGVLGDDIFLVGAGDGSDQFDGGTGYDRILATADNISIGIGRLVGIEEISANGHVGVTLTINSHSNWVDLRTVTLIGIGDIYTGPDYSQLIGTTFADRIFGGPLDDLIAGGGGLDIIHGGGGNDRLQVGTGSYFGDDGNDRFEFASGDLSVSTLTGGNGRDTYSITQQWVAPYTLSGVADIVTDFQTGVGGDQIELDMNVLNSLAGWNHVTDPFKLGYMRLVQSGADTVLQVDVTGLKTSYVDVLRLQNTQSSALVFDNFVDGYNPKGSVGATYVGTANDDTLTGSKYNDILQGLVGNDWLNGGLGTDTIDGGNGTDTASYFDAAAAVKVSLAITNAQNTGGAGTDTLISIENLEGSAYADRLTGNAVSNTLSGGAGNDTLDGGAGGDVLIGGDGNDIYIVDDVADQVVENMGEGVDTVQSSVSFTLSFEVEKLTLTGTANIDGTGNTSNNTLTGNGGSNVLSGGLGDDTLDGGAGVDILKGGSENDTYIVDNVGDQIIENANEGTDTVKASVDYTLSANVEKLIQTGTANITGTGNDLANTLTGNGGDNILSGGLGKDTLSGGAGNDTLNGGAGADKLTGGTGNDMFLFDIMQTATNKDTIVDFTVGQDHIGIDRTAFTAFSGDAAGALNPAEFALGTAATTSSQHLIYNSGTGALYYDADGVGGAAQVQIALLSNHAALSSGDIILI